MSDPVEEHLPEFRGKPITIGHLLTYTTGMPGGGPARKPESTPAETMLGRVIEVVANKP